MIPIVIRRIENYELKTYELNSKIMNYALCIIN